MTPSLIFFLALTYDLSCGEMPNKVHPVVWMGRVIRLFAKHGLTFQSSSRQFLWGLAMALLIPSLFACCALLLQIGLKSLSTYPMIQVAMEALLLKSTFSVRALGEAHLKVSRALASSDLAASRYELRSLCSRDASGLDAEQIGSAAIASLAENLSDSIIAPLFFYGIAGLPGAIFYRTVNTMDAIVGYRGTYEYLGKAPARLDDILNFVPARITAIALLFTGYTFGFPTRDGLTIGIREHHQTPSPNGGWPMAVAAGLLGVQITKASCYSLGRRERPADTQSLHDAWVLCLGSTVWISLFFCLLSVWKTS